MPTAFGEIPENISGIHLLLASQVTFRAGVVAGQSAAEQFLPGERRVGLRDIQFLVVDAEARGDPAQDSVGRWKRMKDRRSL
jgi:hypothetical protein